MNPGSEYEPPTNPYQRPGGQFERPGMPPSFPPTLPPTLPPMPPPPRPKGRPSWLLPTLAAALVVLVAAGGVGAYLVYGKISGTTGAPPVASGSASGRPGAVAKAPDVCSMLPEEEADRLVPDAKVGPSSRDSEYAVIFGCNWTNQRISFGEFWRTREIDVKIDQYRGEGAKTGRAMAQTSFEAEHRSGQYGATAKPSLDPGDRQHISKVTDIPGAGDSAFAQYTFRRGGKLLWYAYGQAYARVGDMTIKVKFQAGQQRKDAQIMSNDTMQAINETNAIREVSGLIKHFTKGAADWQARNPGVLAQPAPSASASPTVAPSAQPTPSPTVLAAFPGECSALTETATRLVPEPTTRARGTAVGGDDQTECRWLNLKLPGGEGITKIRSAMITVHRFTNRAGTADAPAAKSYYVTERGSDKNMADSELGGIDWGPVTDLKGMGEAAYRQLVKTTRGDVHASNGTVLMQKGSLVVRIDYSGHQRPDGEATNSSKVKLMAEKEATDGALDLARAYLEVLAKQPVGS
ncbi:hypothetical protein SAMN05444920_105428 [Nonomuraea solani]|uniref:DUF3558 domain-containing protein n=1 Tax=Nonomuraea solani TaxID=1144553 RepID=A0A1H6DI16_9ACTN|nr:hypothetical protein [Nonomuraea solani]SEG84880.1 hypothetical protein SAMN05444920_105428 [Nonomuraea solani]